MKASKLAVKIIESIAIKGDYEIYPATKLSGLFANNGLANSDYLDLHQVKEITHFSRSTIYLLIKQDQFPRPYKFGNRKVRWRAQDINKWLDGIKKNTSGK